MKVDGPHVRMDVTKSGQPLLLLQAEVVEVRGNRPRIDKAGCIVALAEIAQDIHRTPWIFVSEMIEQSLIAKPSEAAE